MAIPKNTRNNHPSISIESQLVTHHKSWRSLAVDHDDFEAQASSVCPATTRLEQIACRRLLQASIQVAKAPSTNLKSRVFGFLYPEADNKINSLLLLPDYYIHVLTFCL